MAVGELISHLQQEREGLIFRIISNSTTKNGYYILKYHINRFGTIILRLFLISISFSSYDSLHKLFHLTDTTIQNMEWKLLSTVGFPVFDKKLRFRVRFFEAIWFRIKKVKQYLDA